MANTGRMNLLEEEGRIKSEPQTKNVKAEEKRVVGEIKKGYKTGGRVGLKHGTYVKVATPHADINKFVTKSGKHHDHNKHFRKKGSTMTMKTKRKMGPAGRPAGGWTS